MGRVRETARRWPLGTAQLLLCMALCLMTFGCQTTRSFNDGCPGIYSGVRYYNSQIEAMPWDGKIFFAFDLPFSALIDTFLLPFTAFSDPTKPPEGWVPGCEWVVR
jgi:uncharacterized protein YceK